ncbi:hypothetical protein [Burkholderia lata]|uniref:hypothetical protein n=1 Tax=Burkholderia lata (strain ATCC 17760 / DSM 23089 / LMG 22485 / NCIMB 9086 / R18194 / 383) TaxID=482957 RepID=UPI0012FE6269|nr:hypothetical protein [Burkholderia lata]
MQYDGDFVFSLVNRKRTGRCAHRNISMTWSTFDALTEESRMQRVPLGEVVRRGIEALQRLRRQTGENQCDWNIAADWGTVMLIREQGSMVKLLRVKRLAGTQRTSSVFIGEFKASEGIPPSLVILLTSDEISSLERWLSAYWASRSADGEHAG